MHLLEKALGGAFILGLLRALWRYFLKNRLKKFTNKMNLQDQDPQLEDKQEEKTTDENANYKPKGFTAWIIYGLAGVITTVSSILYTSLLDTHKQTKQILADEKKEHIEDVNFWRKRSDSIQGRLNNCDNLDELNAKFQKARQLNTSISNNYEKIEKEIAQEKESVETLRKATQQVKKVIQNK